MVLTGIFILPIELKGLDRNLESNISNTASILSYDSEIIDGLNKKHFSKNLIRRMDTLFKQSSEDVDYLVIATADSTRVYHQKHEYIGKHFTGNDEKNILNGAKPYITTRQGNKDIQKRAFHAVRDKSGKIIGFIMISASLQTIRYQHHKLIAQFLLIFALILCIGLIVAYIIAKNIRKSLLGFEPGTFANMYLQREEILDNLDELILAVDRKKNLLYQNKTSETMENADSFFANAALTDLIDEGFRTGKSLFGRMLEISDASLLVNLIPLPEPGNPEAVLLIMRDKTEIASLAQQLSGTNHVIDALRANTHEYMNKLHVISGLLQIGSYDEAIEFISDVSSDIENAFDATKNVDGIRQVELTIRSNEDGLMISADDTGCGMSEEQIQRIYEGQYTTKGEGHGIGLRLIQEIIKKHEGFLDIASDIGSGTFFTVTINKRRTGYD